jgi:hypothetical protein
MKEIHMWRKESILYSIEYSSPRMFYEAKSRRYFLDTAKLIFSAKQPGERIAHRNEATNCTLGLYSKYMLNICSCKNPSTI